MSEDRKICPVFTVEEADNLVKLLDIACGAGRLQVAGVALHLVSIIDQANKASLELEKELKQLAPSTPTERKTPKAKSKVDKTTKDIPVEA